MASTRKLKRNFSDSEDNDSKSDFETETKTLQRPTKKKKVLLESDSENESVLSNQNTPKDDEKLSSTSDEDEPLNKVAMSKEKEKKQKIPTSFDTSDDEPLAVKSKISLKNLETNKKTKILDSGYEKNGSRATSDEDEPLKNVAEKSKVRTLSNSSDDEILAVKSKNSAQSYPRRNSGSSLSGEKGLEVTSDDDDDDEPIRKVAGTSKLNGKSKDFDYSSDHSNEEPVVAKTKKPSKHSESKNQVESDNSKFEEDVSEATSDEEPISKIATLTKSKELGTSSSDSDDEPLAVKSRNSSKYLKTNKKIKNLDCESEDNKSGLTSEEDEPLNKIVKSSKASGKSKAGSSASSSDDELLVTKSKTSTQMKNSRKNRTQIPQSVRNGREITSDDDDEPIRKVTETSKLKGKSKDLGTSSSDSDDEPLAVKSRNSSKYLKTNKKIKNLDCESEENKHNTSDEEEPISKFTTGSKSKEKPKKKQDSSSSSNDESLANKKSVKKSTAQENSDLSSDDEDKLISNLSKASKEKTNNKKDKNASNGKIEHLKKYLRIAGIHIKSYDKLFENCKSVKSKTEKLLDTLRKKGLKGRPTIEKCKKLKKKIETKKEIAELDTSNIIKSEGRPKRGAGGKIIGKVQNTGSSPAAKKFSRLRDIIDSEESD